MSPEVTAIITTHGRPEIVPASDIATYDDYVEVMAAMREQLVA